MNNTKRIMAVTLVVMLVVISVGCSKEVINKPRVENEIYTETKDENLIEGNTEFAFDIFKEMNSDMEGKNIFLSPLSISQALGMAYNGAEGDTKEAMAKALYMTGIDDETFNNGNKYLQKALNNRKGVDVDLSNSIWLREDFEVVSGFIDTNIEVFDAYVEKLDFREESAADTMNQWIDDQTNGLIDHMIDSPIDPLVVMYLINTIYFKGSWEEAFDEKDSKDREFVGYNGVALKVPSMFRKGRYLYGKSEDYRIIALPYEEKETAMYLILPEGYEDVNTLIQNMSKELWINMQESMEIVDEVPVMLPKFTIEYGIVDIVPELKELGMEIAFQEGAADFTGIGENLYISRVLHKAVIEIDEKGTEAAAATVVEMKEESMEIDPPMFVADRPFIFLIVDEEDETILFMGKVDNL